MCSFGAMYFDEDDYQQKKAQEDFYKKNSTTWDYYSGLPNPMAYVEQE